MKALHTFRLMAWAVLLPCFLRAMVLVENGKALADIVINSEKSSIVEKNASVELQKFLEEATGARLVIREESSPGKAKAIIVGDSTFAEKHGIPVTGFGKEEWLIRSVDGNLVITGGKPRGTIYGVYDFLEKFVGVYFLQFDCTSIRKSTRLEIPDILDIRNKPAFYSRYTVPGGVPKDLQTYTWYLLRNRSNFAYIPESLGGVERYGLGIGHTFYELSKNFPADKPEYFSLRSDGFRERAVNGGGPGQLCISNPEVVDLIYRELVSHIEAERKKNPETAPCFYSITGNDNTNYCQCKNCMAWTHKGGNYSDTTIQFINHIASRLKQSHPDVKIITWAYTYTMEPPKFEKPLDNVIVEICNLGAEFTNSGISEALRPVTHPANQAFLNCFNGWRSIAAAELFIWDYWILYGKTVTFPYLNTQRFFDNMNFFARNNVQGMLIENEALNGSFHALRQWLSHRLLLDPSQNRQELLQIFCHGFYGPAAEKMLEYLNFLEENFAREAGSFALKQARQIAYLDVDFLHRADLLLDQAEQVAERPEMLNRVKVERIPVDNTRLELNLINDRNQLLNRLDENMNILFGLWNSSGLNPEAWQQSLAFLKLNIQPPKEFQDKNVTDFTWISLRNAPHMNVHQVDDPDALGGKASKIGEYGQKGSRGSV